MKYRSFYLILILVVAVALSSFIAPKIESKSQEPFVVVLDAGHGGHDPGNLGNGYFEKDIALKIVLRIGSILEQDPNFKVIYTRKDDTFIDLYVRGEIANKANADLFVSVHCDSHTSNAYGAGTFVLGLHANKQNFEIAKKENSVIYLEDNYQDRYADYDINSPESVIGLTIMQEEFLDQSIKLASEIQNNFSNNLKRNDRKVKQAGFIVLHQTFMPSVLIETGFLTNEKEGAYLNSVNGQEEMGTAIAQAIKSYRSQAQPGTAITNQTQVPMDVPSTKKELPKTPDSPSIEEVAKVEEEPVLDKPIEIKEVETPIISSEEKPKAEEIVPTSIPDEKPVVQKQTPVASKPKMTSSPKKPDDKKEVPSNKTSIEFRVQLLASSKKITLNGNNFKGLNNLSKEAYKNLYRYMYGRTSTIKDAELLRTNAKLKGYSTAFIVAYKDGKRISVTEANKYVSQ